LALHLDVYLVLLWLRLQQPRGQAHQVGEPGAQDVALGRSVPADLVDLVAVEQHPKAGADARQQQRQPGLGGVVVVQGCRPIEPVIHPARPSGRLIVQNVGQAHLLRRLLRVLRQARLRLAQGHGVFEPRRH